MIKILLIFFIFINFAFANILQETIDKAAPYSIIKLPTGIYAGKIIINKPLTIIGKESGVIIKGDNTGDVITINSSNVILKNLTITDSGGVMREHNSGVLINNVSDFEISECKILNSLYGINMMMVHNSLIANNYITSKKNHIRQRGDALKIWYSHNNIIKSNTIEFSRDITLSHSNDNLIKNNKFSHNRFAMHISMSNNNILRQNSFNYNSVGVMIMGAKDTKIIENQIHSCTGAAGIGVVLKETSNLLFENNSVQFNAKGIFIDTKYNEVGLQRYIRNNEISYNKEAIQFHGVIKNNEITNNNFIGNIDDVIKSARGSLTGFNIIESNYWDRYTGFDKNGDNIGDNSHKIYQHADQLWHYNNKVKFFYGSPVISLLNFLSALAPFIEPILVIEDTKPKVTY